MAGRTNINSPPANLISLFRSLFTPRVFGISPLAVCVHIHNQRQIEGSSMALCETKELERPSGLEIELQVNEH